MKIQLSRQEELTRLIQQQLQLSPRIARRPSMTSIGMATNAAPESTHER